MASRAPIVFADVETTGLTREDRVVSLALISIDREALAQGEANARVTHLAFNPERKSHPRAAQVHGFSDDALARQDLFRDHAKDLRQWFEQGVMPVAHNAAFDRRFIDREFELAGLPAVSSRYYCTMREWRAQAEPGQSAALKAILPQLGLKRRADTHGAFEDAWLSMQVFRHLNGMPLAGEPPDQALRPLNWRDRGRVTTVLSASGPGPSLSGPAKQLADLLAPIATLLLYVARADNGLAEAEADVLTELALVTAFSNSLPIDDDTITDAVAALYDLPTNEISLLEAAKHVRRNDAARSDLSKWVRQMTYADGTGSSAELKAIEELSAIFARLRA